MVRFWLTLRDRRKCKRATITSAGIQRLGAVMRVPRPRLRGRQARRDRPDQGGIAGNAPLGIRVNAVCPGAIGTPILRRALTPEFLESAGTTAEGFAPVLSLLGRYGRPEVAQASPWLCSVQSSYVTGAALSVDVGYTSP
jgi:Enoyl-(Acyl carrier protein) reductase